VEEEGVATATRFVPILLVGNFHASFETYEMNLLTDPGKGSCDLCVLCSLYPYIKVTQTYTRTPFAPFSHPHFLTTLAETHVPHCLAHPERRTQTSIN